MRRYAILMVLIMVFGAIAFAQQRAKIYGKITTAQGEAAEFVTILLKDTPHGSVTDLNGRYEFLAPAGDYVLQVSAMGYETHEQKLSLERGAHRKVDIVMKSKEHEIEEVIVTGSGVDRLRESGWGAVAIDTKELHNSTLDLASSLGKATGVKLRESGGVGSDMQFSVDGFTGKHVKVFIDGVPQEGVGASMGLNNIPVNMAERIEVYRGVVPVSFGADALGGVVNIVTGKKRRAFVDASYSYGSFNTHRSYVNAGNTFANGLFVELNAFQNYSDNNYWIDTPVKDLQTGAIDSEKEERVRRFNDTYHNEALIFKFGVNDKLFADRMMLGVTLSQNDKEIQTGVRQEIVFGQKRRKSASVSPTFEYRKRNLFAQGLDFALNANYNYNRTRNIDTATYIYNWHGDSKYNGGSYGEQSYQDSKFANSNWNTTANLQYYPNEYHGLTLNNVLSGFVRRTTSTLGVTDNATEAANYDKNSLKNILGFSYRLNYIEGLDASLFAKHYYQRSTGPRNTSTTGTYVYELYSEHSQALGYGAALAWNFLGDFRAKASYEHACRLPSVDELFGDEDLEMGSMGIKPEKSNNLNISLGYNKQLGAHSLYAEAGYIFRDTHDYIRRVINKYSGGLYFGSYENHGRVRTMGFNAEVRYGWKGLITLGGNVSQLNMRDNERYLTGSSQQLSTTYKARVPNTPYLFANGDAGVNIPHLGGKKNVLSLSYTNAYVHSFPLYWENHGSSGKLRVPDQFSHDVTATYSLHNGRYNLTFECRNLTDAKLYDNFSLQKAGRAFYGKVRIFFQ